MIIVNVKIVDTLIRTREMDTNGIVSIARLMRIPMNCRSAGTIPSEKQIELVLEKPRGGTSPAWLLLLIDWVERISYGQ